MSDPYFKDPKEWTEKYYPVPAEEAATDDLTAARHSLQKWQGALDLSDYGLWRPRWSMIVDQDGNDFLNFAVESCALCVRHWENKCVTCPVEKITGWCCWVSDTPHGAPFGEFVMRGNPQPMIDMLTKVVNELEKENVPE